MPKGVYPHTHIKPKVYPAEMVARVVELYHGNGMSQVEVAAQLGVTLKVVYRLMKNHGITTRPQVKRNQWGSNNSSWRGGGATYAALHKRVEVARGKPKRCAICNSVEGRMEWANLTGEYDDVRDYARMCIWCHRSYDAERRRLSGRRTSPKRG